MRLRSSVPRLALFVAAFAVLAGCDTNNPGGILRDLSGTYVFTELRFVPAASAIQPADVLARLDATRTTVEVDSEGRAFFFLEEVGGARLIAEAAVTATRSTATFRTLTTQDADRFVRFLLPSVLPLSHDGGVNALSGALNVTANLERFDPQAYAGLQAVGGTLYVRMERR